MGFRKLIDKVKFDDSWPCLILMLQNENHEGSVRKSNHQKYHKIAKNVITYVNPFVKVIDSSR